MRHGAEGKQPHFVLAFLLLLCTRTMTYPCMNFTADQTMDCMVVMQRSCADSKIRQLLRQDFPMGSLKQNF